MHRSRVCQSDDGRAREQRALVALGANLGDAPRTLRAAMALLRQRAGGDFRASRLYASAPVDCPPGSPDYVNAVVAFVVRPGESPASLLLYLQALERRFGRPQERARNSPRPLDLDLILFGAHTCADFQLALPHPRALARRFVLEPAAEVAGELVWPGRGTTVAALCADLREHSHEPLRALVDD